VMSILGMTRMGRYMNNKRRPKKNRQELRIPASFGRAVSDILKVKPARKPGPRYLPTVNSRAGSQRER
jgi:hypothetical protein